MYTTFFTDREGAVSKLCINIPLLSLWGTVSQFQMDWCLSLRYDLCVCWTSPSAIAHRRGAPVTSVSSFCHQHSSSPSINTPTFNKTLLGHSVGSKPVDTKYFHSICTMLDQRRIRWANVVQMLYKCFVFARKLAQRYLALLQRKSI